MQIGESAGCDEYLEKYENEPPCTGFTKLGIVKYYHGDDSDNKSLNQDNDKVQDLTYQASIINDKIKDLRYIASKACPTLTDYLQNLCFNNLNKLKILHEELRNRKREEEFDKVDKEVDEIMYDLYQIKLEIGK